MDAGESHDALLVTVNVIFKHHDIHVNSSLQIGGVNCVILLPEGKSTIERKLYS